jgi:hypothetical protein
VEYACTAQYGVVSSRHAVATSIDRLHSAPTLRVAASTSGVLSHTFVKSTPLLGHCHPLNPAPPPPTLMYCQSLCVSVDPDFTSWQRKQRQPVLSHLGSLSALTCTGEGLFAVQANEVSTNVCERGVMEVCTQPHIYICEFACGACAPKDTDGKGIITSLESLGDASMLSWQHVAAILFPTHSLAYIPMPCLSLFEVSPPPHAHTPMCPTHPTPPGAAPQPCRAGGVRLPQGCPPAAPQGPAGAGHAGKHHGRTTAEAGEPYAPYPWWSA